MLHVNVNVCGVEAQSTLCVSCGVALGTCTRISLFSLVSLCEAGVVSLCCVILPECVGVEGVMNGG